MSVVVGFAERPEAERALQVAADEARLHDLPLHVVHIAKVGVGQDDNESILSHRERLSAIEAKYQAEGLDCTAREVFAQGRVSEALIEEARDRAASLLVIGIRSRSAVGKLLVGSVAQEVIMGAACPVLSVKP
ncbi:universal stress protein [Egicoccus sp. AB-alg2]|uniref:universal stress protein n=1 Tax=Egicoccus sp. AB-alg2 TaxID=3242693 RepID=UPI00359EF685